MGCVDDVIEISLKDLLSDRDHYIGKKVKVSGYTPGIPSLLFESKSSQNDEPMKNGIFIDLFELGELSDCIVGNIEITATVIKRGEFVRLSSLENYRNRDSQMLCEKK